jgi:excisionase family DNA binding protein
MENWIDVSEAAEQLGISERQVRNWIRDGKLKAEKINSKWRIDGNLEVTSTIILSLTQQLERKTVALEDMRNKSSFWQRLKMGLVKFVTPSATEPNVTEQRS